MINISKGGVTIPGDTEDHYETDEDFFWEWRESEQYEFDFDDNEFDFDDNDIQVVEEYVSLRVEDDDHPETEIEIATKLHSKGLVDPEV